MSEVQKIAKVISECNDCQYCMKTQEQKGNTFFALICVHAHNDEDSENEPFLIGTCSSDPKHSSWNIPPQCPLEDYNQ